MLSGEAPEDLVDIKLVLEIDVLCVQNASKIDKPRGNAGLEDDRLQNPVEELPLTMIADKSFTHFFDDSFLLLFLAFSG